jgi:hypothetical protein
LSYTTASVKTLALGPEHQLRRTPSGPKQGRFRRWRRSRPFWGGLLLVLAGAELVLIPLTGILLHGAIKLVIYIGIGGVFGVLIGLLMITAGALLWISPAHKTFYAMAGVILAVLSFIASNLGGFFLGMLLGITGGSLAFAWTPVPADDDDTRPLPPVMEEAMLRAAVREEAMRGGTTRGEEEEEEEEHEATSDEDGEGSSGRHRGGSRFLAGAAAPVLLAASLVSGHAVAQRAPSPAATDDCILWILCWPSSSPPPSVNPAPSASPGGTGAPSASSASSASSGPAVIPSPSSSGQPADSPGTGANSSRAKVIARAGQGLEASTATAVLTAGSATLNGLAYQGTAKVPVASGGTQTMMVFTLTSMSLSGNVTTTVTQDGQTTVTAASALDFSGGITLYATKLSGTLLGLPTTLTPDSVLSVLLNLLNTVTPLVPLTMTNVTTDQPLVMAGGLRAANLSITTT